MKDNLGQYASFREAAAAGQPRSGAYYAYACDQLIVSKVLQFWISCTKQVNYHIDWQSSGQRTRQRIGRQAIQADSDSAAKALSSNTNTITFGMPAKQMTLATRFLMLELMHAQNQIVAIL